MCIRDRYCSWEFAQKANKWAGRNIIRWSNDEYEKAYAAAEAELDPVKRAALFIQMNDLVIKDGYVLPLISRPRVRGSSHKLVKPLSGWDLDFFSLHNWYREA